MVLHPPKSPMVRRAVHDLHVRIPESLHAKIVELANEHDESYNTIVRRALRSFVDVHAIRREPPVR